MVTATVREARLNLSKLLRLVENGEEVVIRNRQAPVARLVPVSAPTHRQFPDLTPFRRRLAARMPRKGPPVEQLVRADRDGRG